MPDGICPFAEQVTGALGQGPAMFDLVGFCDHTAGGWYSTMTRASFWNDPNGDGNQNDKVSVHFAIARDGRVAQIVNIFNSAWAQGRLGPQVNWPPYSAMGFRNPNGYLISTEHEDYERVNGVGRMVAGSQWTEAQYQADLMLKRWCVEEVRRVLGRDLLRFGLDSLAGHHMFDNVNRPSCPGRFWRDEYRARLYQDLTAQLQTGGDAMIRLNRKAVPANDPEFWTGKRISGRHGINVRGDMYLGPEINNVVLDVWLRSGGADVKDGDGMFAGAVGGPASSRAQIEVILDGDGFAFLEGECEVELIGMVGYRQS